MHINNTQRIMREVNIGLIWQLSASDLYLNQRHNLSADYPHTDPGVPRNNNIFRLLPWQPSCWDKTTTECESTFKSTGQLPRISRPQRWRTKFRTFLNPFGTSLIRTFPNSIGPSRCYHIPPCLVRKEWPPYHRDQGPKHFHATPRFCLLLSSPAPKTRLN